MGISWSLYLFWYKQPETALLGGAGGEIPVLAFCSPCLWRSRRAFLTFVGLIPFISIYSWLLPVLPPLPSIHMSTSLCDFPSEELCESIHFLWLYCVWDIRALKQASDGWRESLFAFFFYSWMQGNLRLSGSGTMHSATVIWMAMCCCT